MKINVLKKFDGEYNYFNCTGLGDEILFRREKKYKNLTIVSDIVDINDEVILRSYEDNECIYSFEDPRYITEDKISVCVNEINKCNLSNIKELGHGIHDKVKYKIYDIKSKSFFQFKTQNQHFEKHWQFYDNKIIYHINPYVILDRNENVVYSERKNFYNWSEKYGEPRLSTNVFNVNGELYLLFHSSIVKMKNFNKYFIGIAKLNFDLSLIGYYKFPFFESNLGYSDEFLVKDMWEWRDMKYFPVYKYEVFFPLNVNICEKIEIYGGMNDCSAVRIDHSFDEFYNFINNTDFINL